MKFRFSLYKGGKTRLSVRDQIARRWGQEAVKEYDPFKNCFTYLGWQERGFQVKAGEKALISWTFIKAGEKDSRTGQKVQTAYFKKVYLFYKTQVDPKSA